MLLHDDNAFECTDSVIGYINDTLKKGQFVICGSIDCKDEVHMYRLVSRILNHKEHTDQGNLLIVDLSLLYQYAELGMLEPFEEIKVIVEEIMHDRIALGKTGEGLLIGDICGNLARNANFDECIRLERWWDKTFQDWLTNGLKITIVCPYTRSEGLTASHVHIKQRISNLHTATVSEITR